jgi:hypothetical protein
MFPDDWKALCKSIHELAENISGYRPNVQLIGIYLDGLPIARAVEYSLQRFGRQPKPPTDTVLISSKLGLVDEPKIEQLRQMSVAKRVYIDRRTKTGSLGKMLKGIDPEAIYAVLEDPSGKADVSASKEKVPWFSWPGHLLGPKVMAEWTAPFIGVRVAPTLEGKGYLYNHRRGEESEVFYGELYRRMDLTKPSNRERA